MTELFATIYETWFGMFHETFVEIYNILFDAGGYLKMGLTWLLLPLIFNAVFYFVWKYPLSKFWHWLIVQLIVAIIVFVGAWVISYNTIFSPPQYIDYSDTLINLINDPNTGYESHALGLCPKYALVSAVLSIVVGFVVSMGNKFLSKTHNHLPF